MTEELSFITHPKHIPVDCKIAPLASDFYDERRKDFNFMKDKFKIQNIKAGQDLVKDVNTPFITLSEIGKLHKDQIVDYVNQKFNQFERAMPKMPNLYNWTSPDGDVVWSLDKEPTSTQMITHYTPPIDIAKPVPDKKQILEDAFNNFKEVLLKVVEA